MVRRLAVIALVQREDVKFFRQPRRDGMPVVRRAKQPVQQNHRPALPGFFEMKLHFARCRAQDAKVAKNKSLYLRKLRGLHAKGFYSSSRVGNSKVILPFLSITRNAGNGLPDLEMNFSSTSLFLSLENFRRLRRVNRLLQNRLADGLEFAALRLRAASFRKDSPPRCQTPCRRTSGICRLPPCR